MRLTRVVALAGGVGGAKLATGLQAALPPGALTVVVNTGDDFEHWGLTVCPDLDTVTYNLAGVHNSATGWGRAQETFGTLQAMGEIGGEDWFRLGDRDLALNLRRSEWLRQGVTLSEVADRLRRAFGIPSAVLPMCDEPVRTLVHTDEGDLPFQHYFVRRRCEPMVIDVSFVGVEAARVPEPVIDALAHAQAIIFCPSNPYLSLDPILAVPSMRRLLEKAPAPKVAVSPIVGGAAIKGPAAKMMRELGQMISPLTIVDHYVDLLDGFVMDNADAAVRDAVGLPALVTDTLMTDLESKRRLAQEVLRFSAALADRASVPPTPPLDTRLSPSG
jgi:LPPG:FO 2-phospho-L-lactate transferase